MNKPLIGFIGQGFIGKNYGDDFETRGYSVVRYALEEPYIQNKDKIAECDIVFIAVPTPSTPDGFDYSIVQSALENIGAGKIAVVKSTILPGITKELQKIFSKVTLLFSPEFLSEATAVYDAANPFANIVGLPIGDVAHEEAAKLVQSILPSAPFVLTCDSDEAEIIKYTHNVSGYTQIVTFNMMYEMAKALGHDWTNIGNAMLADPLVCNRYSNPLHKSGRGAGGHCFIKDYAAFTGHYEAIVKEEHGIKALRAFEEKNKILLKNSNKDINLLEGVYGKE